jgi:hypothetical protein
MAQISPTDSTNPIIQKGVITACVEIYRRWRLHLSHDDALDQARLFATRCANLNQSPQDVIDFDSVIAAVANAIAAP